MELQTVTAWYLCARQTEAEAPAASDCNNPVAASPKAAAEVYWALLLAVAAAQVKLT